MDRDLFHVESFQALVPHFILRPFEESTQNYIFYSGFISYRQFKWFLDCVHLVQCKELAGGAQWGGVLTVEVWLTGEWCSKSWNAHRAMLIAQWKGYSMGEVLIAQWEERSLGRGL